MRTERKDVTRVQVVAFSPSAHLVYLLSTGRLSYNSYSSPWLLLATTSPSGAEVEELQVVPHQLAAEAEVGDLQADQARAEEDEETIQFTPEAFVRLQER